MNNNIEHFIEIERQQLISQLTEYYSCDLLVQNIPSESMINDTFKLVHTKLVNSLINKYMLVRCMDYQVGCFSMLFEGEVINEISLPDGFDIEFIPQICEKLHVSFLNSLYTYSNGKIIKKKSKSNLLEAGAVYTQEKVAYDIVHRTIS
ncbi:MAG: hypothetical protein Q4B58_08535, partial [Bacteroidales bacterium]|nr:hypothetical protein [Bacteroidales bacterium]